MPAASDTSFGNADGAQLHSCDTRSRLNSSGLVILLTLA